jgi:carbonic anhydrase/acetyltransferase-like protein (isoleucine patch superfamily)
MLIEHGGRRPTVHPSAYVARSAVLSGDVTVGEESRVLHGAVLTSEGGSVTIGTRCVVMEHAVIRGVGRHPARLGDHVLVGPRAHLSGCVVDGEAFLATGTTVFNGATIGARSEVRVNGVVHVNTVLEPDTVVPIGWVAVGAPAEVLPPSDHDRIWSIQQGMDFPGTVWGVDRGTPMRDVMSRYTRALARHLEDHVIDSGDDPRR